VSVCLVRFLRRAGCALGLVVLLTGGAAVPASASPTRMERGPHPKRSGWVAIRVDQSSSSNSAAPMAVVSVGGGTWNYGTYLGGDGWKHCYSQYTHPTKRHSATAIIRNSNDKEYADAGAWANADAYAGSAYTCYAYWSTY
jgi:lactococcin 972 family bacteriocin